MDEACAEFDERLVSWIGLVVALMREAEADLGRQTVDGRSFGAWAAALERQAARLQEDRGAAARGRLRLIRGLPPE